MTITTAKTVTTRTKLLMTPLDPAKKKHWTNFRTGAKEICVAGSKCGRWLYVRVEDTGTPWDVFDLSVPEADPARRPWMDTTLSSARRWTAAQPAQPATA